jgi:zinc protease
MTSTLSRPVSLDPVSVQRSVLPNSLTVLVRRDATAPVVAIVTYVKAGYFDEPDEIAGISHVLEHMYFKGTPGRGVGEIAKQTKASGGYLNASTIYDHTLYYTVLPATQLEAGLDIQSDAYAHSMIDGEELARELEVIIQEAKRKTDNPAAVTAETLFEILHDRHRMRRWRIGHEPALRALTCEQVAGFYHNFYRPSNTIIVIVGDVAQDTALQLVERRYGALSDAPILRSPGPEEGEHSGFRYRELTGDVVQTHIALGWRTPGTAHADTPLLDIGANVLASGRGSRLYRAVRERRLAASVSASNYTPTELGVFTITAEMPAETSREAVRAIWDQVRDMRDRGVAAAELTRAIRLFEARWLRALETMEDQARYLAEWEALGDWTLGDRYYEQVLAANPRDVTDALQRYLTPDRAGWVAYRGAQAPTIAADAEAALALLEAGEPAPLAPLPAPEPTRAPAFHHRVALEREEAGVRVYRTAGGVPILIAPRPGAPIVHFGVYSLGGAAREPAALAGLCTLLARTAVKGTERRDSARIAEDTELLGGSIAPSTASDALGWTLSVPMRHVAAASELLADVVQHPVFPDAAVETERSVALANVAQLRDDMYRYPVRLAVQAAYGTHPYARSVLGDDASLLAITATSLREHHRATVLEAPAVIALIGDVDADETATLLARDFAELTFAELEPIELTQWPNQVIVSAEPRDKAQTALALAFDGPRRRDEARVTAALLSGITSGLGGRFFDELRERQSLGYTVHTMASERAAAGMFVAYIGTSPEKEERARQGLLLEFAKLRDAPVGADELDRAKTYALGVHAIRLQSGASVLSDIVDAWLLGDGLGELMTFEESVRRVTVDGIRALARRYFDADRRVEGIVRGVTRTV